ncbi:hypothetical protein PR202_ga17270 [Eleusine coracana subsp. coracana]|uniref:RING-type domain-containing protein n=1 Tax=Eleusine coracana subsp. coracana TaxID=191504 RepID=A0AAV5CPU6_ELECO|nr:hypothetical protein PR202_ga17270 [Eleusine coracana subsp. coracana]
MQLPDTILSCGLDVVPFILLLLVCCFREEPERVDLEQRVHYVALDDDDRSSSETMGCAICLEPLRHGAVCSEVPACRHVFHRECVERWARGSNSCPLCRAKIVPGSDQLASSAEDIV